MQGTRAAYRGDMKRHHIAPFPFHIGTVVEIFQPLRNSQLDPQNEEMFDRRGESFINASAQT